METQILKLAEQEITLLAVTISTMLLLRIAKNHTEIQFKLKEVGEYEQLIINILKST